MRSPRRPSRPTRSERRRLRIDPSWRPASFSGIWTRRPSVVMTTATWRRSRPLNRPNSVSRTLPGDPGRCPQSTGRCVIVQPLRPVLPRSSLPHRTAPETERPPACRRSRSSPRRSLSWRAYRQRCPASRTRAELARAETARRTRKACAFSMRVISSAPAQTGADGESHGRKERQGPREAHQVALHN
jgi:hypothetical protein